MTSVGPADAGAAFRGKCAEGPRLGNLRCPVARRAPKERRDFLHQPDRTLREQQEDAQKYQAIDQEGNVVERSDQLRDHERDQRADQRPVGRAQPADDGRDQHGQGQAKRKRIAVDVGVLVREEGARRARRKRAHRKHRRTPKRHVDAGRARGALVLLQCQQLAADARAHHVVAGDLHSEVGGADHPQEVGLAHLG